MLNLTFDPVNKLIRIRPFTMTLIDATEGNNYVDVDSIPSNMPQEGWLSLPKTKASILGTKDMSAGYDFSVDPRNFLIISGDGLDYEVIDLNQKCDSADEIVNLINLRLQETMFAKDVEAFAVDGFIGLRLKDPYWGEVFSFTLEHGNPDALSLLGIQSGTWTGTSDVYSYTSWSGTRIYIENTLTRSYPVGVYCAGYYETINVQDLYNDAMDWHDNPESMSYPEPMHGYGFFPLGGGAYTDKIYVLVNGWQILPHSGNYRLSFIGTLITDDGRPRVIYPRSGVVEVTFQVSSQGIIAFLPEINTILNTLLELKSQLRKPIRIP